MALAALLSAHHTHCVRLDTPRGVLLETEWDRALGLRLGVGGGDFSTSALIKRGQVFISCLFKLLGET